MKNCDVRYLPAAEEDLMEIVDYLTEHSLEAANKFIDKLDALAERLSMFPESGAVAKDRKLKSKGYRIAVIDEYLMFYIIQEDVIIVMRIIHGKRNYKSLLI